MIADSAAGDIYGRLWAEAESYFRDGRVEIDPHLRDKANDQRLGLSIIGRPGPAVNERFVAFVDQARQVAPGQYFYQANEFHLTVLSLFTATTDFEPHWENLAAYQAAVAQALSTDQAFTVRYQGVTASKNAVLIQGFALGPQLDHLRASLRRSLRATGLESGLDQRYTITMAHSTVIRFVSQPKDLARLLALLHKHRTTVFGQTTFRELYLVKNDWYMSHSKVETLKGYSLAGPR